MYQAASNVASPTSRRAGRRERAEDHPRSLTMTAENAQTAMLKARRFAGILSSESSGVMAVMRQNSRWALTGMASYGYGEPEEPADDPMLEEFKAMRRRLFTWRNWDEVSPIAYLAQFLQVVRSVETSGPITG